MQLLIGDSIILRPFLNEDADELAKAANNKEIADHLRDSFPYPYLKRDAVQFIEIANSYSPVTALAIVINHKVAGAIAVTIMNDIYRYNAELGYWLARPYWGKKIISEAIKAMLVYTFSTFPIYRIFAKPFPDNIASIRVLEKNGFSLESIGKDILIKNGKIMDELTYSIIDYKSFLKIKSGNY